MSFLSRHRSILGMRDGLKQSVGVSLAGGLFSFVFGVLAIHHGISFWHGFLMTSVIFAGALQIISLPLWQIHPIPVYTMVILALVISSRYILMGMCLRPKLRGENPLKVYLSLFFIADETWALTILKSRRTSHKGYLVGFLFGACLLFYILWVIASCCGMYLGALDPESRTSSYRLYIYCYFSSTVDWSLAWEARSSALGCCRSGVIIGFLRVAGSLVYCGGSDCWIACRSVA